jgi:hypothetical protein
LIIDDIDNEDIKNVVLGDDGTSAGIRIPSLMISKKDGQILKKWFSTASEKEIE